MIAKTFFGFEEILAKELQQLGAQEVEIGTHAVSFKGDKGFMYKANLALRTALKILKPIHRIGFECALGNSPSPLDATSISKNKTLRSCV